MADTLVCEWVTRRTLRCFAYGVAIAFALLPSIQGRLLGQTPAEPGEKAVVYKTVNGTALHLYIFMPPPEVASSHSAIVFFHGGGWTHGTVTQFDMQSAALAARGMVAIDVEYRLVAPAPSREAPQVCVEDAKSAMRWVRKNAKELQIDPNRIAASGGSAGGYLAAAAALIPGWNDAKDDQAISPKPNALILFFPVLDVSKSGYGYDRFGTTYETYSPENYLTATMPPTIIFGGSADKTVKPANLENFKELAEKAGGHCKLLFYPDQPHGFANKEPYRTMTLNAAEQFLVSLGYIKATASVP